MTTMRLHIALLFAAVAFAVSIVFAQPTTPVSAVDTFKFWMLLPLIGGMVLHWAKGYTRGTINGNFWDYFRNNLGLTIAGFMGGVGALFSAISFAPDFFDSTKEAIIACTLIGYAGDSAIGGEGSFIKRPIPPADAAPKA